MDAPLVELAPAKINLDLLIQGRRPDGYHELDSLVVFGDLADRLGFWPSDEISLTISGPFAEALDTKPAQNLVIRAAKTLRAFTHCTAGVAIHLEKNIPVAAGLGGGSADAAACFRALNRFWGLGRANFVLRELALEIGADVPVCILSKAARMRGLGARIDPISAMPELPILLVNPGTKLSTKSVFDALELDETQHRPRGFPPHPSVTQLGAWLGYTRNDLERPAIAMAPKIGDLLQELASDEQCVVARMSGSGATCFGLFLEKESMMEAADRLSSRHPDCWIAPVLA